jgi:ATP-dependent helicase/nuclease subunit B
MILSKSKIQKLDIDNLINDFIREEKLQELLIIVPTNRKIRYLKRELISNSPNKSVSNLNLHTFETFTKSIFSKNNFDRERFLSDATAAVLLNKSFKETKLNYFSNYKNEIPRGTLDRIKNVISEYKLNGISPEQVLSESNKLDGSEKLKAVDIANVYKNYLKACKELSLYEVGDIYSEILLFDKNEFDEKFRTNFDCITTIIVNGFDEFTQPEIEIINLAASKKDIKLFVVFDFYKFNPALFSHLDKCYMKFVDKGFSEVEDISQIQRKHFQSGIREKLFLLSSADVPKKSEVEIVEIVSKSPEDEIILIAKEIKNLILQNKNDSSSIAVVFNLISDHSVLIRDVFNRYGIPYNLTDRYSLGESQPIIALINLLEILENNFYYKNIFRALTGKWIGINGVDLSNLLRVSSNLKIVAGYNNWIETIERTIDEIKENEIDENNLFLPLWSYEKAKGDIEKIYSILKPFRFKKNIPDFQVELYQLIAGMGLQKQTINDKQELIEKNVKALTVFLQILDELFELLKLEYGVEKEFILSFYLTQIKTSIQFTRYNIKERHSNGVLVTSVNEIRGLKFDYIFIGGLIDGEFPTRYQPEIFFSGSYKKDEQKHILEDRYHFYQTLCSVNKKLYLTHSLNDGKKEFTTSTFVEDFKRLFNVKTKLSEDYDRMIFSKQEALKYFPKLHIKNQNAIAGHLNIDINRLNYDLEIDKLRLENPFNESTYSGYLLNELNEDGKVKLLEQENKQYSASQLEEYAKCPFQYFAKRILQLEIIDEPTEDLEALELGSIVHSILYEFYKTLGEKNIAIQNCDDKTFSDVKKIIFSIAENKIEKLHLKSESVFFEKEKILGVNGERKNSILYKFIDEERKNDDGYLPSYFELEFGDFSKPKTNPDKEFYIGKVKVRGKIDRVDIDAGVNNFKVIDYKLGGKKPAAKDLQSGLSLQLPLYVYVSKTLIETEQNKSVSPGAVIIYSLKLNKDEFGKKIVHLLSSRKNIDESDLIKSNEELIKICNEFIPLYVDKISKGIFNLSQLEDRENKVCRFCDFKSICRIQEAV